MREKKTKNLWGVPVKKGGKVVDRCESHIILKQSGLRKRPRKCLSPNIAVVVMWCSKQICLCHDCWTRIANSELEWDSNSEAKDL